MSIWPLKDTKWAELTHAGPGLLRWCCAQQGAAQCLIGNLCKMQFLDLGFMIGITDIEFTCQSN